MAALGTGWGRCRTGWQARIPAAPPMHGEHRVTLCAYDERQATGRTEDDGLGARRLSLPPAYVARRRYDEYDSAHPYASPSREHDDSRPQPPHRNAEKLAPPTSRNRILQLAAARAGISSTRPALQARGTIAGVCTRALQRAWWVLASRRRRRGSIMPHREMRAKSGHETMRAEGG
ncbi:hypothetical protein B0H10DRAFT_4295 [Mycena sp. CBHHK59/15]|nr:hypothetical protein B0H10DRAFT_4295 [Mycena sp. CBHHK59/15]